MHKDSDALPVIFTGLQANKRQQAPEMGRENPSVKEQDAEQAEHTDKA